MTHVDYNLGAVLDKADEHGLRDNAVVVFTADHGFSLGEHSLFGKGGLYEMQSRVPLLVSAPGLRPRRISTPVALLDVAPTLLAYARGPRRGRGVTPLWRAR